MGATNSVSWMFERKGQIYLDATRYEEDPTLEAALDAGATDFAREDDQYIVSTDVPSFHTVKAALEAKGIVATESEIAWIPKQTVRWKARTPKPCCELIESLEELDDVQKVDANFDIDVVGARGRGDDDGSARDRSRHRSGHRVTGYGCASRQGTTGPAAIGLRLVECGVIRTRPRDRSPSRCARSTTGSPS